MNTMPTKTTNKRTLDARYGTTKMKEEVRRNISRCALQGMDPSDPATVDAAADTIANDFGLSRQELSWFATRHDLMNTRKATLLECFREVRDSIAAPYFPDWDIPMQMPNRLPNDDGEVIERGDSQFTLRFVTERLKVALEIIGKEREAHLEKADELEIEANNYTLLHSKYVRGAEHMESKFGISSDELIYDSQTKKWAPRPNSACGRRPANI